jgi:terminal uridylyltransferase
VENFRAKIETISQNAIAKFEQTQNGVAAFPPTSVQLKCFGSLSSGFATKASDMDVALLSPLSKYQPDDPDSPIPRLVEKALLEAGLGARLLSRTRVPIIKLCEQPPAKLKQDLLEEREKWEKGIPSDPYSHDHDDEGHEDTEGVAAGDVDVAGKEKQSHHRESSRTEDEAPEPTAGQKLAQFRQADKQSLANYYAATKRLLRKLGGRDITYGTARDFTEKDFSVLTDVCHAFVSGLADDTLKSRLRATVSLATKPGPSHPVWRSLAGVYTQIEGERFAMMWDQRQIHERDETQEQVALSKIALWRDTQNKPNFAFDLLAFNKELQFASDQLKKIPSLQLMALEQGQFESAAQYHHRVIRILLDLGGHDSQSPGDSVLPVVIEKYVTGIYKTDIRAQVSEFVKKENVGALRAISRRHKSLQLASEFERALEKSLYPAEDVDDIRAYIDILRSPLRKADAADVNFDFVIPKTPDSAALVDRVRELPDPSKLAPNQPRDPYHDRLEFPKSGAGVQCDINFSAHLALHNTLLLRCYSHTDPRVRPIVLFVKHWAKVREVNSPYRGTLSSYGYVLMVFHYLVNIVQPFVCPNLQHLARASRPDLPHHEMDDTMVCKGKDVRFWRDEQEILRLAGQGLLNQNQDSVGQLLRGFFEYFAQSQLLSTAPGRGFDWGRDVLSLRTPGGILTKQTKGWTGAKTVLENQSHSSPAMPLPTPQDSVPSPVDHAKPGDTLVVPKPPTSAPKPAGEVKEVRHRYLFAIEDPFELEHNVARTVTHNGIVAIRDEFRRAWRIIRNAGKTGLGPAENLLQPTTLDKAQEHNYFSELVDEIHGRKVYLE